MTRPIVDLGREENWAVRWIATFQAQPDPQNADYTYPIAPATCPILLESPILALKLNAPADTKRKLGGWLNRKIRTGITPGGVPNVVSFGGRRILRNETNLIIFNRIDNQPYALELVLGWWMTAASVTLYEYIGPESDTTTEQLNRIEMAIDNGGL